MHILVTGGNGQLGSELRTLSKKLSHRFTFVDVGELDITNGSAVNRFFKQDPPDVCINCAAYTAVDKAEEDTRLAYTVNADGPENLAVACNEHNTLLIHISTDFVFDGKADTPYTTDHPVSPINVYGASKAEGEQRVLLIAQRIIIVRTSWVYSSFGGNFVKTMIRLGKERESLNVVDDQKGQPTYARDLAAALLAITSHSESIHNGIYHYSNKGAISWCDFAQAIMEEYGLDCKVNPIPSSQYPTPAERPAYSVLDLTSLDRFDYVTFHDWRDSLQNCISIIKSE